MGSGASSRWGVTPDIVTLGKPMGNGHPIAAVVTRADIVDRFGHRPPSSARSAAIPWPAPPPSRCSTSSTTSGSIANAVAVGDWLRDELPRLAARHPVIGDVRGRGLMTGVELVARRGHPRARRRPGRRVKNEMAERGVLIGTAGRQGNVLKIRPPLCITRDEARLIVDALDEVLD